MTVATRIKPTEASKVTGSTGPRAADRAAKGLLDAAHKEMPFHEGRNNDNPYTQHVMGDRHQPWCAAFVSTMLEKQNIPGISRKMFSASARGLAGQFQQAGRYVPHGSTPQPGDAIFFGGRGSEHHVGLVEKVENGRVYTIEGKSHDQIRQNSYPPNDP